MLQSQTLSEQKKKISVMIKEKVGSLSLAHLNDQSLKASELLLHTSIYVQSTVVLSYMAMDTEINPRLITQKALAEHKQVALPRIVPHTADMQFYFINDDVPLEKQLEPGCWGILEPKKNQMAELSWQSGDMFCDVVPGVAFTRQGERLGHGKGFYDRFFLKLDDMAKCCSVKVVRIGMCLEEQLIDFVPTEDTDVTMDYILTATKLYCCK